MSTWCTYPLSLVTKRGSSFWYESNHIHKGRVSIGDFWVYVFSFLSFTFTSCILVFDHLTYIVLIFGFISIDVCYLPIFTCVVSFLSLCTWFLNSVCNLLFLFHTKMPWWVLFKVFQKYRLSKSSCHELSSCKVFQEFVLGYILFYSTSEYELSDLWLFSYVHLFVVVLSRITKGEIIRTYVI